MTRLLELAIRMASCRGGVLLIDEIDTGLYHEVLPNMWEMVILDAVAHGTQAFATTHSLDCIRALDDVCRRHVELGEHISVQKMVPGLEHSVAFDAGELHEVVEVGAEIR